MQRVLVIGCSGSGKITLAKQIAQKENLPFIATDPLYWQENWQLTPKAVFLEKLSALVAQESWVMDGNFDDQRDWVWARADTIIWLDYAKPLIVSRVIRRNARLFLTQKTTWSNNKMTFKRAYSGVQHAWRSHKLKKECYPNYLACFSDKNVLHFKQSKQAEYWLAKLANSITSTLVLKA